MENNISDDLSLEAVKTQAKEIKSILGMNSYPVGVRFPADSIRPDGAVSLKGHRYCQALMRARRGGDVVLDAEGIACPAAAQAFGFKPLPEALGSGKGLVGYGIASDPEVGKAMFRGMSRLAEGEIEYIHLFPLEKAAFMPDVIIMEDETEKLMWIMLAYMHVTGGARVRSDTAVLQATCVDATVIPYTEQRLNASYGCYGCREATDIGANETILGFPVKYLEPIAGHVKFLAEKAINKSRGKDVFNRIEKL
jgi:uncharacterized protein (DUF169 family)